MKHGWGKLFESKLSLLKSPTAPCTQGLALFRGLEVPSVYLHIPNSVVTPSVLTDTALMYFPDLRYSRKVKFSLFSLLKTNSKGRQSRHLALYIYSSQYIEL